MYNKQKEPETSFGLTSGILRCPPDSIQIGDRYKKMGYMVILNQQQHHNHLMKCVCQGVQNEYVI